MTVPATSDVNFTPTSTEALSPPSGVVGVAVDGQRVQGAQLGAEGVTGAEPVDAGPVPTALVALTVKV